VPFSSIAGLRPESSPQLKRPNPGGFLVLHEINSLIELILIERVVLEREVVIG
jgi:hypothetical protein